MKIRAFSLQILFVVFFFVFNQRVFTEEKLPTLTSTQSWVDLNWNNPTSIPFRYPLELDWIHPSDSVSTFSESFQPYKSSSSQIVRFAGFSSGWEVTGVKSARLPEAISRLRDQSSGIPSIWQPNQSPMIGQARDVAFIFLHKNFSLILDMSMTLMGNPAGHSVVDHVSTSMGVAYLLPSQFLYKKNLQASFHLNVQTTEILPWEDKLRKTESKNFRNYFISPGLTLGNRTVRLEGLIRMPIPANYQEMDALFQPEIQGRLGLKWNLPDMMRP